MIRYRQDVGLASARRLEERHDAHPSYRVGRRAITHQRRPERFALGGGRGPGRARPQEALRDEDRGCSIGENARRRRLLAGEGEAELGRRHQREEHLDVVADDRAVVGGVGHPDDGERQVVDLDGLADDLRIGCEVVPPQAVADDHDRMAAGRDLVGGQQGAAALRMHPEHVEVVPGDELGRDRAGAAPASERDVGQSRAEQPGERLAVLAQVQVVGIRQLEGASGAGLAVDHVQPGGALHTGERRQGDAFEHGEDGGIQADAKREHADHGQREPRLLRERAQRIPEVARQVARRLEPSRRPHLARCFGRERDIAEVLQRRVVRADRIGALGHPLASGNGEVGTDLVLEVVLVEFEGGAGRPSRRGDRHSVRDGSSTADPPEPVEHAGEHRHDRQREQGRDAERRRELVGLADEERQRRDQERRAHAPQVPAQARRAWQRRRPPNSTIRQPRRQGDGAEHQQQPRHPALRPGQHREPHRDAGHAPGYGHSRGPTVEPTPGRGWRQHGGQRGEHEVRRQQPGRDVDERRHAVDGRDRRAGERHEEHRVDEHPPAAAMQPRPLGGGECDVAGGQSEPAGEDVHQGWHSITPRRPARPPASSRGRWPGPAPTTAIPRGRAAACLRA